MDTVTLMVGSGQGGHAWESDLITHTCSGRLLRRDVDRRTTVLDGLACANGVALPADKSKPNPQRTLRVSAHDSRGRLVDRAPGCGPQ